MNTRLNIRLNRLEAQIEAKEQQFPLLLIAVLLPLMALPFADLHGNSWQRYGLPVTMSVLILQTIRALPVWEKTWRRLSINTIYRLLGILSAINSWIPFLLGHNLPIAIRLSFVLIRASFFLITAIRIIQVLAASTQVNARTLALGAAGYIQMGLTGGQLATALQLMDNDSFKLGSLAVGEELVARLSYFSFVTIGTLGFGDVVPASPIGESFVVMLSITSTLYVSLLIGVLLGRYIHSRTRSTGLAAETQIINELSTKFSDRLRSNAEAIRCREQSFPWFLTATLLPILAMPFTNLNGNLAERLCLPVVALNLVLQSMRIMPPEKLHLKLLGGHHIYRKLGLLSLAAVWLTYLMGHQTPIPLMLLSLGIICSFSVLTALRIIQMLAQVEGVNGRTLCLGSAGYVQLGITAGQLATTLYVVDPESFMLGQMLPGSEIIERLTYFSFTTLGSIGYGDILPSKPAAEFFAVGLSITGTLYISLIIGLLLSRYINDNTPQPL